jgi:hypothetical protein
MIARRCRLGRPSLRPASAGRSRCCPPGGPVRYHRRPVHVIAPAEQAWPRSAITRSSPCSPAWRGCRWAAVARLPGPGRISAPHRGNRGAGRAFSPLASGHGPSSREMVVPFRLRQAGRGIAAGGTAEVTAASQRGATGPGGPGEGCVPVPRRALAGGPERGVGLLAPGAGQPAEGIDAPASIDRAGPGVGLAERCRIGMPGDARAHLAPHDRHPQLITDHSPHGSPGRASGRGRGGGPGRDSGGSGPVWGGGRGWGGGPGAGFGPGTAVGWLGTAMAGRHSIARACRHGAGIASRLGMARAGPHAIAVAGRHGIASAGWLCIARAGGVGTFAVPELGEPVVHLKHGGVAWPDHGLHVGPPVEPGTSRAAGGGLPWGRTRRPLRVLPAGSGGKRGGPWSCRAAALALSLFKAPGLTVSGFGLFTVPALNHGRIKMRLMLGLFMSFRDMACGQFPIPLDAQGAGRVLPVGSPFTSAA